MFFFLFPSISETLVRFVQPLLRAGKKITSNRCLSYIFIHTSYLVLRLSIRRSLFYTIFCRFLWEFTIIHISGFHPLYLFRKEKKTCNFFHTNALNITQLTDKNTARNVQLQFLFLFFFFLLSNIPFADLKKNATLPGKWQRWRRISLFLIKEANNETIKEHFRVDYYTLLRETEKDRLSEIEIPFKGRGDHQKRMLSPSRRELCNAGNLWNLLDHRHSDPESIRLNLIRTSHPFLFFFFSGRKKIWNRRKLGATFTCMW